MSGTFTLISRVDDRTLQRDLKRLLDKGGRLTPCLKNIGQYLVESTQGRFTREEDPSGKKWAALKPSTLKRKKHTKILTESHALRDSIIYAARNNGLRVGTNKVYAAAHQFGLDKNITLPAHRRLVRVAFGKALKVPVWAQVRAHQVNPRIPARPFLGFSQGDRREISAIVQDFIEK